MIGYECGELAIRRDRRIGFVPGEIGQPGEPRARQQIGRRGCRSLPQPETRSRHGRHQRHCSSQRQPHCERPRAPFGDRRGGRVGRTRQTTQIHDDLAHRLIAIVTCLFERLLDDAPQSGRQFLSERSRRLVDDRMHRVERGVPCERSSSFEQLVEDDAKREDVATSVERLACGLFGGHVRGRADHHVGSRAGHLSAVALARQTEVGKLRVSVLRDQDVFRLDVAVQDAGRMRGSDGISHACQQLDEVTPAPRLLRGRRRERAAIDELGDEVLMTLELADLVNGQDLRMVQRRGEARLAQQTLSCGLIGEIVASSLMATGRLSLVSTARYTTPMPPSPRRASIRYAPSANPDSTYGHSETATSSSGSRTDPRRRATRTVHCAPDCRSRESTRSGLPPLPDYLPSGCAS